MNINDSIPQNILQKHKPQHAQHNKYAIEASIENLWTSSYQQKFKKLGNKLTPGITKRFLNFFQGTEKKKRDITWTQKKEKEAHKFAIDTYLGTEHLGENVRGFRTQIFSGIGIACYAYQHAAELLECATHQDKLSDKLGIAGLYLQEIYEHKTSAPQFIHKTICSLKQGESLICPAYSSVHAMLLHITCTEDQNGKRKYKCIHHNEGQGIETYHYKKLNENGKLLYQTALEIINVPEENLSLPFFQKLCSHKKKTNEVYEFLQKLKGTIAPPSDDPRLWSPGQLTGSCLARCIHSLVRAQLSPEEYGRFIQAAQYDLIFNAVKQIRRNQGNLATAKILSLETINQLEMEYKKWDRPLPEELQKLRKYLKFEKTIQNTVYEKIISDHIIDHLQAAFKNIKESILTNTSNIHVENLLIKALELLSKPSPMSDKEAKKVIKLYKMIIYFFKQGKFSKKLTMEQTYIMTAFASIMKKTVKSIQKIKPDDARMINRFIYKMQVRFNGINYEKHTQLTDLDTLIEEDQKILFRDYKPGISVPQKLREWKILSLKDEAIRYITEKPKKFLGEMKTLKEAFKTIEGFVNTQFQNLTTLKQTCTTYGYSALAHLKSFVYS